MLLTSSLSAAELGDYELDVLQVSAEIYLKGLAAPGARDFSLN